MYEFLFGQFFTDEDLGELPFQTRLAYQGLWCHSDKEGRLEDRPKFLKIAIFPYDDDIDMEVELELLSQVKGNGTPFIQRYQNGNSRYIQIVQWDKHQKPHHTEKESIFPPPENPPQTPPKIKTKRKIKGMGKIKQLNPSTELKDGDLTVKPPLKKQKYREFVTLTLEEYKKLVDRFGKDKTEEMLNVLDNGKGAKGYKYKSDYRAILSWVVEKVEKNPHDAIDKWEPKK